MSRSLFLSSFFFNELGDITEALYGIIGDITLFANGLSALIGLALFKLHGFSTDDAFWTPPAFGYLFG